MQKLAIELSLHPEANNSLVPRPYMKNGGKLEVAQEMAGHESARTAGLYHRADDEVSLDESSGF